MKKTQLDNFSSIAKAKNEGIKEGKKEGIKEGLEKGKQQGGYNAKIETAKNMLQKGLDVDLISQCTGLSIDVIKEIQ